ncbi:MAG: permease [Bacilli bacterium]|nr:permease [Bacilli bacterium]
MQDLSIIFLSILLEAIPFILLGVFVSALIEEFVSPDFFSKIIPKNPILGAIVGVIMGFFVPACDCAVIPISKRLIKKGVPINVAITFMLASPIVNPVVILSTFYAFGTLLPKMIIMRTILGIILAIIIGYRVGSNQDEEDILKYNVQDENEKCGCESCNMSEPYLLKGKGLKSRMINILIRANKEFWDICKYLIIGALIASVMQVYVPRDILTSISSNSILSIVCLMIFAYLLSLCSTSDSFVAKTFINQFSNSAVLAFLLLGPMIDIKNTIVLTGNYQPKFIVKLLVYIFVCVFLTALIIKI